MARIGEGDLGGRCTGDAIACSTRSAKGVEPSGARDDALASHGSMTDACTRERQTEGGALAADAGGAPEATAHAQRGGATAADTAADTAAVVAVLAISTAELLAVLAVQAVGAAVAVGSITSATGHAVVGLGGGSVRRGRLGGVDRVVTAARHVTNPAATARCCRQPLARRVRSRAARRSSASETQCNQAPRRCIRDCSHTHCLIKCSHRRQATFAAARAVAVASHAAHTSDIWRWQRRPIEWRRRWRAWRLSEAWASQHSHANR